jgi:hypothetical protein
MNNEAIHALAFTRFTLVSFLCVRELPGDVARRVRILLVVLERIRFWLATLSEAVTLSRAGYRVCTPGELYRLAPFFQSNAVYNVSASRFPILTTLLTSSEIPTHESPLCVNLFVQHALGHTLFLSERGGQLQFCSEGNKPHSRGRTEIDWREWRFSQRYCGLCDRVLYVRGGADELARLMRLHFPGD